MITFHSAKPLLVLALVLALALSSGSAFTQAVPWLLEEAPRPADAAQTVLHTETSNPISESMAPQVATPTAPSTVTIPAGTRVLMVLKSPLHTTSGTAGSGIYLETLYPVIQGNRVVIPAHTEVEGVVEANERPGHVKRASEFRFRFTSLIFPNNFVAPINGALQSIPGARKIRTRDRNGTLKPVDQMEKVVTPAALSAVGGAIIGAHRGFGIGLLPGAGLGAALGLGGILLKRGDEISLAPGTSVEMILLAPLNLDQSQVIENARYTYRPGPVVNPSPACATSAPVGTSQYPRLRCRDNGMPKLPLSDKLSGIIFSSVPACNIAVDKKKARGSRA